MERKDRKPDEPVHGGNQGTAGNEDKFGNKSFAGATSTDFDKQRMQTVEANDLDDNNPREGNTGTEQPQGVSGQVQSRSQMDNRAGEPDKIDDLVDQGTVRTAAFDEGNEPRSKESLANRGKRQGSDDTNRKD